MDTWDGGAVFYIFQRRTLRKMKPNISQLDVAELGPEFMCGGPDPQPWPSIRALMLVFWGDQLLYLLLVVLCWQNPLINPGNLVPSCLPHRYLQNCLTNLFAGAWEPQPEGPLPVNIPRASPQQVNCLFCTAQDPPPGPWQCSANSLPEPELGPQSWGLRNGPLSPTSHPRFSAV
jgi:hypothetical protein